MLQIPDITDDPKDPIVRTVRRRSRKRVPLDKRPVKWLRKTKWTLFSEWLRRARSDRFGKCRCVTCGWYSRWNRGIHAGHYRHAKPTIRYHLWNVNPQCEICNCGQDGARARYASFLQEEHGRDAIERIDAAAWDGPPETRETLARDIQELRANIEADKDYRASMGWPI